jgi:hypothetical protein
MGINFGSSNMDVKFVNMETGESFPVSPVMSEVEYTSEGAREWNFNRSATLTMSDCTVNRKTLDDLLNDYVDPIITIKGHSPQLNRLRYLHKRTKNSRIKRKLMWKIFKLDHPIYHDGIDMKLSQIEFK